RLRDCTKFVLQTHAFVNLQQIIRFLLFYCFLSVYVFKYTMPRLHPFNNKKKVFRGVQRQCVSPNQPFLPNKIMANQRGYEEFNDDRVYDIIDIADYSKKMLCLLICCICQQAGGIVIQAEKRSGLATKFRHHCTNCNKYEQ